MADHPIVCLMYYAGAWNTITSHVSQVEPVTLTIGDAEISAQPRPSTVALTLTDPDGRYRPSDAMSPLYGTVGRNTPIILAESVTTEDFEDASLNVTVANGSSDVNWARDNTQHHAGSWSFASGNISDNQLSEVYLTAPSWADVVMFYWKWSTEADADIVTLYAGDHVWAEVSGTGGWVLVVAPIVTDSQGRHALHIAYQKDSSTSSGLDGVFIDDLTFLRCQTAEVTSWAPDRTLVDPTSTVGRRWTDLDAAGVMRRIGSWSEPIGSAMYRYLTGLTTVNVAVLTDYWPGEDGSGSTRASSATGGLASGPLNRFTPVNMSFGQTDAPLGSSSSFAVADSTNIAAPFSGAASSSGWTVGWAFKLAKVPTDPVGQVLFEIDLTGYWAATVFVFPDEYNLDVTDNLFVSQIDDDQLYGTTDLPDQWILMTLSFTNSGATTNVRWSWYPQGAGPAGIIHHDYSFASSALPLVQWTLGTTGLVGDVDLDGALFCQIFTLDTPTLYTISTDLAAAFDAHDGETTVERLQRLMEREGMGWTAVGDTRQIMGPQASDTLAGLLRELRDTEYGLIYDTPGELGTQLRGRRSIYGVDAALTLTFPDDISPPFREMTDDTGTANSVTATNRAGGYAVATDADSPMGTAASPTGIGTKRGKIDVNVHYEDELQDIANQAMRAGTLTEARYSDVTVDLDANPSLEASAAAVRPGDRIKITGAAADTVDLLVVSRVDNRDNQKRRTITFTCRPFRPYDPAFYIAYGDTVDQTVKRRDSRASLLNAGYSSSATTMVVKFATLKDQWSQTNEPYDWVVAGERITVTSMGAVSGPSGGFYTQSATVTRHVNGVVKAQTADTAVRMHPDMQARYAR